MAALLKCSSFPDHDTKFNFELEFNQFCFDMSSAGSKRARRRKDLAAMDDLQQRQLLIAHQRRREGRDFLPHKAADSLLQISRHNPVQTLACHLSCSVLSSHRFTLSNCFLLLVTFIMLAMLPYSCSALNIVTENSHGLLADDEQLRLLSSLTVVPQGCHGANNRESASSPARFNGNSLPDADSEWVAEIDGQWPEIQHDLELLGYRIVRSFQPFENVFILRKTDSLQTPTHDKYKAKQLFSNATITSSTIRENLDRRKRQVDVVHATTQSPTTTYQLHDKVNNQTLRIQIEQQNGLLRTKRGYLDPQTLRTPVRRETIPVQEAEDRALWSSGPLSGGEFFSQATLDNRGNARNFQQPQPRRLEPPGRTSANALSAQQAGSVDSGGDDTNSAQSTRKKFVPSDTNTDQLAAAARSGGRNFNDPLWKDQWYITELHSNSLLSSFFNNLFGFSIDSLTLNVEPVWKRGITGKGVVVTILDDGLEGNHSDLAANYDPQASFDLNGNKPDPTPRYHKPQENHHGTRCAGEVAMMANNGKCGVGIAYEAKIGGVRMLDGTVTDRVEAESLTFALNHIDVYSSSWGPADDGIVVEGPGWLAKRAFETGVQKGRNGNGAIYVWASGNGGLNDDSCAADGYASSIYTLCVGSATENGNFPIYGEMCTATMAVTYSSGMLNEGKIVSTDVLNECTEDHTGTSASAPLAAGIVALGLQANGNLTWRDVQHIIVWTSDPRPLFRDPDWSLNAVGLYVNPKFGFGLMNAENLVEAALRWVRVPEQVKCTQAVLPRRGVFYRGRNLIEDIVTDGCQGTENEINYLEHVELLVTVVHPERGAMTINMTSPSGTRAIILPTRRNDKSSTGLNQWPLMSTHTWGEHPAGTWKATFSSLMTTGSDLATMGQVRVLTLVMYGTRTEPEHIKQLRLHMQQKTSRGENGSLAPRVAANLNNVQPRKVDLDRRALSPSNTLTEEHRPLPGSFFAGVETANDRRTAITPRAFSTLLPLRR